MVYLKPKALNPFFKLKPVAIRALWSALAIRRFWSFFH